ncbi:MAG: sialidase family protein [Bryobacteraceae bacterium]
MRRRDLFRTIAIGAASRLAGDAQEVRPIGQTEADQKRNAELLSGYEYDKYTESLTGYAGQDRQRVARVEYKPAVRTRVGPRGNYKAGIARLPNGRLVVATCRFNNATVPEKKNFDIHVYESADAGFTWQEVGRSPLHGKEPSLTALPDGSLILTAQKGYFGPGAKLDEIPVSRSTDGGRTWTTKMLAGWDYPRNLILEPNGSLTMIRAVEPAWYGEKPGSPNILISRSKDGGENWNQEEGVIDWDYRAFGEISSLRLNDGTYLASLRRQSPGTRGEGFEETMLTWSSDGGARWSKPTLLSSIGEVHVHLLQLRNGQLLASRSNYHLPFGVYAATGSSDGRRWDWSRPYELALSAGFNVGWPVTLELPDTLITVYGATTYLNQSPNETTCEVVRWRLD